MPIQLAGATHRRPALIPSTSEKCTNRRPCFSPTCSEQLRYQQSLHLPVQVTIRTAVRFKTSGRCRLSRRTLLPYRILCSGTAHPPLPHPLPSTRWSGRTVSSHARDVKSHHTRRPRHPLHPLTPLGQSLHAACTPVPHDLPLIDCASNPVLLKAVTAVATAPRRRRCRRTC